MAFPTHSSDSFALAASPVPPLSANPRLAMSLARLPARDGL